MKLFNVELKQKVNDALWLIYMLIRSEVCTNASHKTIHFKIKLKWYKINEGDLSEHNTQLDI